jgi:hypothetical protein
MNFQIFLISSMRFLEALTLQLNSQRNVISLELLGNHYIFHELSLLL